MLCSTHCEFGNEARNDAKPVDCSVDFRKCKLDETSNEMTVHTVGLPLRKVSCSSTRMRSCSPVKEHVVFMSVSPCLPFTLCRVWSACSLLAFGASCFPLFLVIFMHKNELFPGNRKTEKVSPKQAFKLSFVGHLLMNNFLPHEICRKTTDF